MGKTKAPVVLICFSCFFANCGGGGAPGTSDQSAQKDVAVVEMPDFIWVFDDGIDEAIKPDEGVIEDKDEIGPQEEIDSDENNDFEVAGAIVECDTKEDCESLMCVVANDGKNYCAPFCPDGECPEGWECYEVTSSRHGDTKVCLPRATYLCRPCIDNEDCAPYGAKSKLDCVMLENSGRFCLPRCGNCPQGYFCSQVMQDHCVPESGACECIAEFISGAYETVCYVENEYGKCEGKAKCTEDGGFACSASTPAPEQCNGIDDDCDGETDEDFPQKGAPCDGDDKDFCMEGVYVCNVDGTALYCTDTTGDDTEICNNIDDDCDGVTDNGSSLCPPASFSLCDGDVLVSHSGQGTCIAGTCSYPIVSKELCAWGCEAGHCKPCSPSCAGVLCGDDGCGGSCGQCPDGAPLNPAHNQVLNILGRFWMPNFGDGDHMTTTNPDENPGGTFEGQMFYVPAGNASGTHALFRLLASNDHMDSTQAGEGGYRTEFILGYPFDSPNLGLCEIRRWFSHAQTDHMTAFCNEDASTLGYQKEGVLGYGFPRHGNNCEVPIAVAGSEVTIVSNLSAGGAISELWWNGKQFINDYDYGRQVQIAFNQALPGETDNPTEGGDKWGCPGARPAGWAHGSIVLSYSVEQGRLTTLTSPLQWSPENFGGGRNNPVRWLGTIGKTVELDFAQIPHAIKWTTTITFPGGANFLDLEIVTAYLNSEFNRFYAYDAFQQSLADMTMSVPNGGCLDPSQDARLRPVAGGVIISTPDGAHALGVYRRYGRNNFGLCKFLGSGGTGKYGFQTTKWNVLQRQPNGISPGTHSFTVYLVVGTLQDAVSTMRTLFERGH